MKKLDLKTKLYLYITGATVQKEKKYTTQNVNKKMVYIFHNYDEFKEYFKEYIVDVKEDIIDLAIYAKSKNGEIIALKGLCDYIITKSNQNSSINVFQEQREDINLRSEQSPFEKVKK